MGLILASTTSKLQLITGQASQINVHVSAMEYDASTSPGTVTPVQSNVAAITTAATTDILAAPAASKYRNAKFLSVRNTHATASCDCTVQHTDGTNAEPLFKATLAAGEQLTFNEGDGFEVFDSVGRAKSSAAVPMTVTVLSVAGSGTYNTPAGCRAIDVCCVGGGGGSAGVGTGSSTATISGGGGSGGFARKLLSSPAASYAYTVGAAGAAGASTPAAGGNGGNSTFGTSLLTGPGGQGSPLGPAAGTTDVTASGGIGGAVGTGGDINASGSMGFPGHRASGTAGVSGGGGDSVLGGGGNGRSTAGVGSVGDPGTGGGGGGSFATSTAQAGAAGSAGVIVVYEYY